MSTNTILPPNKRAIHDMAQIIKHVEAELGALFINSKLATQLRHTLAKMGHPQPPMPVQIDNSTTYGMLPTKSSMSNKSNGYVLPLAP